MTTGRLTSLLLLICVSLAPATGWMAAIVWGTHEGRGAMDSSMTLLPGIRVPGGPVDFSNGALVQLWKAVGEIEDPQRFLDAYRRTSWSIDDILLDSVHIGYGLGPPGAPADGEWSRTADVDIVVGDIIYARAYNMTEPDWEAASIGQRELTIRSWLTGEIVFHTVTQTANPETYYFDDLGYVPEPASSLFLLPGLAAWLMRRKRTRNKPSCSPPASASA